MDKTKLKQWLTRAGDKFNAAGETLGKMSPIVSGGASLYGMYDNIAGNSSYDFESDPNRNPLGPVSIGNYDALSDWRQSQLGYMRKDAKDFDTMTGAGKVGSVLGLAGSGAALGTQIAPGLGTAIGTIGGTALGILGLEQNKKERERDAFLSNLYGDAYEDRINNMYFHELGDIAEEQANQAYANISAKGGKIHIAPSKRGTFKAQAKRMGMSVQQAARHILAHKDRYSPAMRRKANFARNFAHAYGGNLFADGGMFEHPAEYNHGGFFSLDPELIKINQGGTHEMNPLDGVPMGFDENGIPNLVEEGETIFDDYVFSNRLAPTEQQLAEGGLPTKYKDHTFADISAKIAKQYEETPNDEISKESMKESMQRLRTIQEQVKEDKEAEEQVNAMNDFAMMSPEEQQAVMSQQQQQQQPQPEMAGVPEEMPQEEMPQDLTQNVPAGMEAYSNAPVDMMSYGGNLFDSGGTFEPVRGYQYILRNKDGEYKVDEDAINEAVARSEAAGYPLTKEQLLTEATTRIASIVRRENDLKTQNERKEKALSFIRDKYGEKGITDKGFSSKVTEEDRRRFTDIMQGSEDPAIDGTIGPSEPTNIQRRKTDGVAGRTVNAKTGAGNSSRRFNTARYNEGMTAEQKREAWYNSSGKALIDSLNNAKQEWDTKGLKGDELKKEQRAYVDAMNAVQEAYTKAYEAGYDPKTSTSNKDAAVRKLQELWESHKGNKYFDALMNSISTKGISGDNKDQGWVDALWGDITRNRNWGLTEYYGDSTAPLPEELRAALKNAGITYTPEYDYGNNGYKAYKLGLMSDRTPMGIQKLQDIVPNEVQRDANGRLQMKSPSSTGREGLEGDIVPIMTPNGEVNVPLTNEEADNRNKLLPTWMRYAPILGNSIGAIWNMAQKPDYSVAEAVENTVRQTPRVRFNPIGNYLTYRPVDRNYYLNQVRNQGLATQRGLLNSSGANQGAASAALLANQYNTQTGIGNSLMQQELANRQNEQQVAQFNRGTDQYNSQGLFNESIYNQRAGMQRAQMGMTAAQLRQAERQRRNAAISADLTNLFQGIGDIGWENFNANMVNTNRAMGPYGIDIMSGAVTHNPQTLATSKTTNEPTEDELVVTKAKYGGKLLTKRTSKKRRK